jgi:DNA recombination protein RmuC
MILDPLSLAIGLLAGAGLVGLPLTILWRGAKDSFRAASAEAMMASNQTLLALAEQQFGRMHEAAKGDLDLRGRSIESTVAPVSKTLETLNLRLAEIEKDRASAHGELRQHFSAMSETHGLLRSETGRLVQALRTPMGRGGWGEMQLERLLEMAGMVEGIHYDRQASGSDEDRRVRPDIVLKMTGGKSIVIDAKTPMEAYLQAIDAEDDVQRGTLLKAHAAQVRDQMRKLGQKEYWKVFSPSPEFVVMFMPSEGAVASALQQDLGLIEEGMRHNVVVATPMTLFALLRTIMYGWRQETLSRNAAEIAKLGAELYDRIGLLAKSHQTIGDSLGKAVEAYNKSIGQIETRVLATARRLKDEHQATSAASIEELKPVEEPFRQFSRPEMLNSSPLPDGRGRLDKVQAGEGLLAEQDISPSPNPLPLGEGLDADNLT